MANTNDAQLRPISEAAEALNGIAPDATADEIAQATSKALTLIASAMSSLEVTDGASAVLADNCKQTATFLRNVGNVRSQEVAKRLMETTKGKARPVSIKSGDKHLVVTPKVTYRRSEVDRYGLIEAVERLTANPVYRLDPNSDGELLDYDVAKVRLFKKAFRMEPRWSAIKQLGLQEDEFCRRETHYQLDVKEVTEL